MGYNLRAKVEKNMVVKCTWNCTDCDFCLTSLQDYSTFVGLAEIPEPFMKEFMAPHAWFEANEKIGCPHGKQKLLKSVYAKT